MYYDPMIRALLGALSPAGPRSRLTILIFHRVLSSPDPLFPNEIDATRFERIISWLSQWFSILPLSGAVDQLNRGVLPARAACITFDDGYRDNVTNALPILTRHGATATFFIATGYLGTGRMWNDTIIESVRGMSKPQLNASGVGAGILPVRTPSEKREAIRQLIAHLKYRNHDEREELTTAITEQCNVHLPRDLMMDDSGVRRLHEAGMLIGAHTVDHPILRLCDENEARRQISDSRDYLEGVIGEPVRLFAYPNGKPGTDYTTSQARLVESLDFQAAVSTAPGASSARDDIFQLRRFTPWDRKRHRFGLRLAQNLRG
ncbi:polysaccharide deacetylase family protein [Lentisalinibacter salinarum]|uniref:polysaccharide deacetylase family protein n=1 Tax=Lentisalinibacter salinarum TaxID=2992239 RepID=UPI00386A0EDF